MEGPRSALTNTPLSHLGGFNERIIWKPPVETFEKLRSEGTIQKVVVARVPLKKSQIVNYFDKIREVSLALSQKILQTKDWQRMIEYKNSTRQKEYLDVSEMTVVEMLKNLVGSKDNQPKGQLILKHLSPLHNLRGARDVDTVSGLHESYNQDRDD